MNNQLTISIVHENGEVAATGSDTQELCLTYDGIYEPGDRIVVEADGAGPYLFLQADDALGEAFVHMSGKKWSYMIPFGEKRIAFSAKAFAGARHLLTARIPLPQEIAAYKNLAKNILDQHGDTGLYPHASANVETRGEAVFAARNAIDGIRATASHGEWPYASWGINQRDDAAMLLEFGRRVRTDRIRLYTRSDFPHDNWWRQVTLSFSDGSVIVWDLEKSHKAHEICFDEKTIEWVRLEKLIKADDPSPFPALTQIEVYGTEA